MAEPSSENDKDLDPAAEKLANDFDDELNLNEDKAVVENDQNVIKKEQEDEIPLGSVLTRNSFKSVLGFEKNGPDTSDDESDSCSNNSVSLLNQNSPFSLPTQSLFSPDSCSNHSAEKTSDLAIEQTSTGSDSRPLLRSFNLETDSSDVGTEYDYLPYGDWRKTRVGADYQAVVPEGLSKYDDAPPYENTDRLLWDPNVLPDDEVLDYLRQYRLSKPNNGNNVGTVPIGGHVRDDEQALFLLLQCGHDKEEAVRRRNMQPCTVPVCISFKGTLNLWSEDECRSFETGIKLYGKNFHQIQLNKVRTRAVSELVQFYYFWKKTERHDVFATKNRIEKKKYTLHPGATDFMERFLDEQDVPILKDDSVTQNSRVLLNAEMRHTVSSEDNFDNSDSDFTLTA